MYTIVLYSYVYNIYVINIEIDDFDFPVQYCTVLDFKISDFDIKLYILYII